MNHKLSNEGTLLVEGSIEPDPNTFKARLNERGYFPTMDGFDITKDVKYVGGSAYGLKNDTFMLYEDEIRKYKILICVKVHYSTKLLLSEEVYILHTKDLDLSKFEVSYSTDMKHKKYRVPASIEHFKVYIPRFNEAVAVKPKQQEAPKPAYDFANPEHYKSPGDKTTLEKMVALYGIDETIVFFKLSIFKYKDRLGKKPGEDVAREVAKIKKCEEIIVELLRQKNESRD